MRKSLMAATALLSILAGQARADPCEAIPQDGPLPPYLSFGASFSGEVAHVIDGDSLCIAVGPGPKNWVEVRLADFYAPESGEAGGARAKAALEQVALGRRAACVANMRTHDRVAARCRIAGEAIGDLMQARGIAEGGAGTRQRPPIMRATGQPREAPGALPFRTCAAARAAGATPVRRGEPGYNPALDGDGDGLACEPYRRR